MVTFHRKPVSFHAVSFGTNELSQYLRRMADIAYIAQKNASSDVGSAVETVVSSYTEALDTVQPTYHVWMIRR